MKKAEPNSREMKKHFGEYVVITTMLLFSFWLMFHTFGYDRKTDSILIASRLWSDFGAHIPMIRSFSMGANLDRMLQGSLPDYPIYPGEPVRYHSLFYALVGLLEKLGLRIDWALNIPSILGFFALLLGIYVLAQKLFKSAATASLSVLFFLFNGSLSFIKYFSEHSITELLTIREFPSFAPWGPGQISAFWNLNIYTNQRHLAAGFAIGVWFLVWVARSRKNIVSAIGWGLLIGILPYFHQPMLLIMAIILTSCFLFFPTSRFSLIIVGAVAAVLIAPQLLMMPKSESLAWFPGYLIHDDLTIPRFPWYWFQNLGLHAILIPLGFFFIPNVAKRALAPLFAIFLVANLFRFSVEVAANHKFFNFALILGNIISAYVVWTIVSKIRTVLKYAALFVFVGILTLSGIIDFFVIRNDVKGAVADVTADERAAWIAQNTPKDAIFLNSSFLYHPASVAGRSIFLGWPYFPWSLGYTGNRHELMRTMYESHDPKVFCPLLAEYSIDYVTVENTHNDPNLPVIDVNYFISQFQPVYSSQDATYYIFTRQELCQAG